MPTRPLSHVPRSGRCRSCLVRALNFCMIKVWPTETVSKYFDTGNAAGLRGDAKEKKKEKREDEK